MLLRFLCRVFFPAILIFVAVSAQGQLRTLAFVTNNGGNTVTVIDTRDGSTQSVVVGAAPVGVAADASRDVVYVANSGSGSVSRIEGGSLSVTTLDLPGSLPEGIAVDPLGSYVLVTSQERRQVGLGSAGVVYIIDPETFTLAGELLVEDDPEGIVISDDGRQAWIAADLKVQEIDLTSGAATAVVTDVIDGIDGVDDYEHVAVNAQKSRLFVSNASQNRVEIVDLATEAIIDTVATGLDPEAVMFEPGAQRVHVTAQQGGSVTVIDASTEQAIETFDLGPPNGPRGLAFHEGFAWVAMSGSNVIARYEGATRQLVGTLLPTGAAPEEITMLRVGTNRAEAWQAYP